MRQRAPRDGEMVQRHRLSTRVWHGVNAVSLLVLLMSGLMIFNAHPRLYWGEYGANFDYAWLEIGQQGGEGFLRIGSWRVSVGNWLGAWNDARGIERHRAFPYWATLPSTYNLAAARIWHLAFVWVLSLGLLAYLLRSLVNGHLRRDIHITRAERRFSNIWDDIKAHARLRFPTGTQALRYSVLQKLAYAAVLFAMVPLMIATGLAMSPGTDAWAPLLTQAFGGRQSARSVHFLCAWGLVAFVLLHVGMVMLTGPINHLRSIVTGWYRLPRDRSGKG